MLFTSCMGGLYLISMVKDIGVQLVGLSAATAANAVAMIAIFNTVGRIILGTLSDKIGRMKIVCNVYYYWIVSLYIKFHSIKLRDLFCLCSQRSFALVVILQYSQPLLGLLRFKTIVQITGLYTKGSDLVRLQDHSSEHYSVDFSRPLL